MSKTWQPVTHVFPQILILKRINIIKIHKWLISSIYNSTQHVAGLYYAPLIHATPSCERIKHDSPCPTICPCNSVPHPRLIRFSAGVVCKQIYLILGKLLFRSKPHVWIWLETLTSTRRRSHNNIRLDMRE